jgi:DNA-binding CsgD family transcriptional regulator
MKTNNKTVASTFINLFPKKEEDQLSKFSAEEDDEIIVQNFHFAEKVFPQSGLMLCPVSHARSKYFSLNCERLLGHSHQTLMKMELADFFGLVHPDDLLPVKQCLDFIRSLHPYDPETHRFITYYRIRNKQGEYVHIKDEKFAVKTQNNLYLYLILLSNVSGDEKFYHVKMDVNKILKGNYVKAYTYNPRQEEKSMTPRQHDIVRLIIKGFTNHEIADQLRVSVYTVKNHKQMLFKKVNVKNSIELANYVQRSSL